MLRRTLEQVTPGAVLGKTIYDELGRPLLKAGTELAAEYIESLRRRGVLTIYVHDGLADDVVPTDIVSERVRATITDHVATTFAHVAMIAAERGMGTAGVEGAADALGERPLDLGVDGRQAVARLYEDVEALIAELLEGDTVAGLESLKTHNEYTFQHSVDVAVVGVLLGRRMGMPVGRLRELALGCLLHDIGKVYIDRAILDKPGKLTGPELEAMRQHPRMGYELIRRMPVHSLLPAHVAYQHHERQRGSGYPRGLVGDNSVAGRLDHERIGSGRMLLVAEIAAVADVYSALTSDRPYRPALLPDAVATMLEQMAGPHLNRALVTALRRVVPRYPVGRWVHVTAGSHAGYRGIVTAVHPGQVDRPTVRLVLDDRGESLAAPFELDLRAHPDVALACVADGQVLDRYDEATSGTPGR